MRVVGNSASGGKKPTTPTIGSASAGSGSASVSFTPSTYIGKGTVTYIATSSPGSITGSNTASPITVSGLSDGTAYTFTVRAQTPYGVSSESSASSNSATPVTPAGLVPTFGSNTSTSNGFTGSVTNRDGVSSFNFNVSAGTIALGTISGSIIPFTVTGLSSSQSATVTCFTVRAGYSNGTNTTTGTAAAPSCTPSCGAWSYTYGAWSAYSACSGGTQSRTRTVTGTRTCQASDCSYYNETSSTTETETQSCGATPCCQDTGGYYCCGSFHIDACFYQYDPCANTVCGIRQEYGGCG